MAEQTLKFPFNKSKEAGFFKGPRKGPFFHFPFAICYLSHMGSCWSKSFYCVIYCHSSTCCVNTGNFSLRYHFFFLSEENVYLFIEERLILVNCHTFIEPFSFQSRLSRLRVVVQTKPLAQRLKGAVINSHSPIYWGSPNSKNLLSFVSVDINNYE